MLFRRVLEEKNLFLLCLLSLLPLGSFFFPGIPLTHDGQDHIARIANFCQSLSEGNLIPRWAKNLNWGYGHPVLMFLYPLPSYLACFFHRLSFDLVASTKIVFGLSFFLSGLFMYLWITALWGKEAGFISAIFYLFAPYRFVDLYIRGAIGECWAFVWPPLICWFALKLSRRFSWWYLTGGSVSLACLILSHNALSLMFLLPVLGYIAFLIYSARQKWLSFLHHLWFLLFGFSLSAFFWLPALYEGKYTLREIVTKDSISGFEPFWRLLYSPWRYGGTGIFSVQLGILHWLVIALTPYLLWRFWRKKEEMWIFLLFLFVCFWLAIFLILPPSRPLYLKFSLLQKFQFAWRFLSLAVFPPSVFAGTFVFLFKMKEIKWPVLALFLFLTSSFWIPVGFLNREESFYTSPYPGTTDTGESAPRWSVRFMEEYPKKSLEIIKGKGRVEESKRLSNYRLYRVHLEERSRLVENTLYFPGWQVFVDGEKTEIEFQDPSWRGLVTFWVSPGRHKIELRFSETRLRTLSDLISLLGLGMLVLGGIMRRVRRCLKFPLF